MKYITFSQGVNFSFQSMEKKKKRCKCPVGHERNSHIYKFIETKQLGAVQISYHSPEEGGWVSSWCEKGVRERGEGSEPCARKKSHTQYMISFY